MKKLSLIIFFLLTLQNLSYADTISEYEEAGLKLGKSILEVMTFEKIIESVVERSKDERYLTVEYVPDTSVYPSIDFNYYLTAMEYLPNDFEGCVKKQNIYANKFEKILRIKKEIIPIRDFSDLYGAGSKWRAIIFEYPVKANAASVLCYHYGDFPEENNLKINFFTRDYADSITID